MLITGLPVGTATTVTTVIILTDTPITTDIGTAIAARAERQILLRWEGKQKRRNGTAKMSREEQ